MKPYRSQPDGVPALDSMAQAAAWRVGAATVPLPVPLGTPLAGYVARGGAAAGVRDELEVGALLIEQGGARLAIVTADVAGVDRGLVDQVSDAAGLNGAVVLVCASHTHSGPVGIVPRLHPSESDQTDETLRMAFVSASAEAVDSAREGLRSGTLWVGRSRVSGVAANRNDPTGPRDDTVTVIAARGTDGTTRAMLVHFACHPTVLGAENLLVSADFPGAVRRGVAAAWPVPPRSPVVLFVNGAAGDVSTRFTRRGQGFVEVERLGRMVAGAALEAVAADRPIAGGVRAAHEWVRLAPAPEIDAGLEEGESGGTGPGDGIPARDAPEALTRLARTRAEGAALAVRRGATGQATTIRLEAVSLGEVALVAVPGELLAALGRRIEAGSPFPTTMVIGYANGYVGYLTDGDAFAARTYELLASPFAPSAGAAVVETAGRLLSRLARLC